MHEENKFSYRPLAGSKDAEWHFALGLDDVTKAGSYAVRLYHRDLQSLGVATNECDKEHYTFAHLFVSESAATGKQQRVRTIGQTLFLTLCTTNEVKVLARTCEVTPQGAAWKEWTSATAGDLPTPQELDTIADSLDNKFVYKGSGDVDVVSGGYFERTANDVMLNLKKWGDTTGTKRVRHSISAATETQAGVMSATDKVKLNNAEPVTRVQWTAASNINTYTTTGTYLLTGERLNTADGLPITNSNPGHTIHARLLVLDSSISGTGDSQDKCITQVLTLSNRTGGDGDVYIRTGRASVKNQLAAGAGWEPWGKLQQNIEVGQVTSLNSFTGNGIYSGVYTNGNTFFETFVMVVINNYIVAGATGQVRSISQFKYALNVDGTFSYKTRTGQGNSVIEWGSWVEIDNKAQLTVETEKQRATAAETKLQNSIDALVAGTVPNGTITAEKLSTEVKDKVDNPLRSLFIAAGAEYNDTGFDVTKTAPWGETVTHKAGHYYLNGLGDITQEQMVKIYNAGSFWLSENTSGFSALANARTNLPPSNHNLHRFKKFDFTYSFNDELQEVIVLVDPKTSNDNEKIISAKSINGLFIFANKLKRVYGTIDIKEVKGWTAIYGTSLQYLYLSNMASTLRFNECVSLSKDSVLFMINNSIPTTIISVVLHPDAYARLADDAEIVAALEAQPLVSLVSA